MILPTDELPTEAIPVVAEDHEDDLVDDGWTQPRSRSRSRLTVALVALLLVAVGFLAGVLVERTAGASNAPQRTGPAATSMPRAGASGPFARL